MISIKKYLIPIVILIIIISFGIIAPKNKDIKTYELKANHSLEEGNDIHFGTYILKAEEEGISVNINEKDGSSVSSLIIVNNDGEKYVETEIKIPKETIITTDKDAILINK